MARRAGGAVRGALRTLFHRLGVIPVQMGNTASLRGNAAIRMGGAQPGVRAPHIQRGASPIGMVTVSIGRGSFLIWMAAAPIWMATVSIRRRASPIKGGGSRHLDRKLPTWMGGSPIGMAMSPIPVPALPTGIVALPQRSLRMFCTTIPRPGALDKGPSAVRSGASYSLATAT